jgi:putative restriction endonuclease
MSNNFQLITIGDTEYAIVDSIQNLRAEDSFIAPKNKMELYDGSGEARKYVGSYKGENGKGISAFFEFDKWGEASLDENGKRANYLPIQTNTCFFSKQNILKYLEDAKVEYFAQEQVYKKNIAQYYHQRLEKVKQLKDDYLFFSIYDVSDLINNKLNRAYIRSDEKIWMLWRELVLPKISYLSILKLLPTDTNLSNPQPLFYFRVFLDYQFRSIVHPSLLMLPTFEPATPVELVLDEAQAIAKERVYRKGAIKYRNQVIEHMPQCPFTKISDERLLIASHIKPYQVCMNEDNEAQALDYLNGLALTPTYDKLFDQGYITFLDNGEMVCGTQLSALTWQKLNINPNAKNIMRIYPENREFYLDYHRQFVFLDDINTID